ncbi:MAG: leucine-rich repeat domain-containing protein [Clostridia bacterium]|nr:leucine-rich repeat domain-containing protein [Clostridia bacterium]
MRHIGLVLLLVLLSATALGEGATVTYRDYGGKLTVSADSEQIDLGRLKVENYDAFERFLDALPNLRRVDMYTTHMFKKQAKRLSERYPQIEFGWTMYIGDHMVRTDQTAFSTLHDSVVRRHTSEELEALRYCRALRALDLGHNDLTDISFLAELDELRVLILADNRIEDLSPLSGLGHLTYLELFDNRVASLEPLAGLPALVDLNIAQNRAQSLEPLYRMPGLSRLWLRDCGEKSAVTGQELERLADALEQTEINAVSLGTEGGWRAHPHYDVVFEMFKGTTYIPFEDTAP